MLTLTSAEQDRLARAVRVLSTPFDYDTLEAWMEAAAAEVRAALDATTGTASYPDASGVRLTSGAYPDRVMEWYRSFYPLLERIGYFERLSRSGVVTRRDAYGAHHEAMQETAYVQEFLPAVRAYDALSIGVPWRSSGTAPDDSVQLLVNTDRPDHAFGTADVAKARLLHPALAAGVASYQALARARAGFCALLDGSGAACAAFSPEGRALHRTPALTALLAREPLADRLAEQLHALARGASGALPSTLGGAEAGPAARASFEGGLGTYTLVRTQVRELGAGPAVLVTVTASPGTALPGPDVVRERFGLTRRQAEVALLLAERRSNQEIADVLSISVHTARHHVAAVLNSLKLTDRREVEGVLREADAVGEGGA